MEIKILARSNALDFFPQQTYIHIEIILYKLFLVLIKQKKIGLEIITDCGT